MAQKRRNAACGFFRGFRESLICLYKLWVQSGIWLNTKRYRQTPLTCRYYWLL